MDDFNILRKKRKERGYTLAHVAADLDLSVSMICKLEKGIVSFTKDVVEKLNDYYDINLAAVKYECSLVENNKKWYIRENDELKLKNDELKNHNRELLVENKKLKMKLLSLKNALNVDINIYEEDC